MEIVLSFDDEFKKRKKNLIMEEFVNFQLEEEEFVLIHKKSNLKKSYFEEIKTPIKIPIKTPIKTSKVEKMDVVKTFKINDKNGKFKEEIMNFESIKYVLNYFPFLLLPRDMIFEIIKYLGVYNILILARTCKELKKYCYSDNLWKKRWKIIHKEIIHEDFINNIKDVYMSNYTNRCYLCRKITMRKYSIVPCLLCIKCNSNENFKTIGKSEIINIYKFRDLSSLRYISYSKAAFAYRMKDVVKLINSVHGEDYMDKIIKKRKIRSDLLSERKKKKRENELSNLKLQIDGLTIKFLNISHLLKPLDEKQSEKRLELLNALTKNNLVFRQDSELCNSYVTGNCDKCLCEIIETMKRMKFIHGNNNFNEELTNLYVSDRFIKYEIEDYFEQKMWNLYFEAIKFIV